MTPGVRPAAWRSFGGHGRRPRHRLSAGAFDRQESAKPRTRTVASGTTTGFAGYQVRRAAADTQTRQASPAVGGCNTLSARFPVVPTADGRKRRCRGPLAVEIADIEALRFRGISLPSRLRLSACGGKVVLGGEGVRVAGSEDSRAVVQGLLRQPDCLAELGRRRPMEAQPDGGRLVDVIARHSPLDGGTDRGGQAEERLGVAASQRRQRDVDLG